MSKNEKPHLTTETKWSDPLLERGKQRNKS